MLINFERKLNNKYLVFATIFALSLCVYINSFFAPFTLDDFSSITNNYAIRNPLDFATIWNFYSNRFILYFTISLNYFFNSTDVFGYHVVNFVIHVFIVYLILNKILNLRYFTGKSAVAVKNIISLLASSIFVCHPVQVNAVTYIIQRTASLAATFYLMSVLFYIQYRTKDEVKYFLLVVLFTIMAMFTKENTITIPFMLAFIEFLFFMKEYKITWQKRCLVLFILFLTIPIIPATNLFLGGYSQSDPNVTFKASTSMNRMHYFYTQMNVIIDYIKKILVPYNLNFDYGNDYPISTTIWENNSYVSLIILLIIGIFSLIVIKINKLMSFGIIWFFIGLSVESSFISIKDVYFEHRLYFPLAGFAYFLVSFGFIDMAKGIKVCEYKEHGLNGMEGNNNEDSQFYNFNKQILSKYLRLLLIVWCIMIIGYSCVTLYRNYIFSDSIRLWTDVVKKAPNSDRAHSVLATNYLDAYEENKEKKEYLELAEKEFLKAISLNHRNSTAHCNLAKVYLLKGQYEKCIEEANIANQISKSKYAYNNLGNAYLKLGKTEEALKAFLKGYELDPRSTFILKSLGDTYYLMNDLKNASFYYEEYLKYCGNCSESEEVRQILDKIIKQQSPLNGEQEK